MPRRDGTGPMGRGTKSGRGLGPCTSENVTRNGSRVCRRLNNFENLGMGYGCRRGFVRSFSRESLTEQKAYLQNELDFVNRQLENTPETNK